MTLIMMAKQPWQIVPLFNKPFHVIVAAFVKTRNCSSLNHPTALSQAQLHASNRVFTNAATPAFLTSRRRPVS
jgi:hypothetical protein